MIRENFAKLTPVQQYFVYKDFGKDADLIPDTKGMTPRETGNAWDSASSQLHERNR